MQNDIIASHQAVKCIRILLLSGLDSFDTWARKSPNFYFFCFCEKPDNTLLCLLGFWVRFGIKDVILSWYVSLNLQIKVQPGKKGKFEKALSNFIHTDVCVWQFESQLSYLDRLARFPKKLPKTLNLAMKVELRLRRNPAMLDPKTQEVQLVSVDFASFICLILIT